MRKILLLIAFPFAVYGIFTIINNANIKEAQAVDPLVITYDGNTTPDPVFEVFNMLPGDEVEKEVKVKNNLGTGSFNVDMDGIVTEETANFADILEVIIGEVAGPDIYGGTTGFKTLQEFLDSPPMDLGNFPAGVEKIFRIKVKFPSSAGNEYQLAKVVFNLKFTTFLSIELPPECESLRGTIVSVIEGTEGNDNLHGNVQGNLILAKGGNDKIDSSSSSDCVVGGDGNDNIDSESGDDIIIAGAGNDKVKSGSGNDQVWGGDGNDSIDAGSGTDTLYGEIGNDTIKGGSDNDYLNGGENIDNLHGNSGIDTCVAGETLNSCEI